MFISPTPTASGKPYTSPYPDIPITGPTLTPEQTDAVNAMATFESVHKNLVEKIPANYDALEPLASPGWASLLSQGIKEGHKNGRTSRGWETIVIRYVEMRGIKATISSCSDTSTRKYGPKNSPAAQEPETVKLRTTYVQKVAGIWRVTGTTTMGKVQPSDSPPKYINSALSHCRAYFGHL